ncbi:MAG: NAD-dependent epimerase/dehydratase family protein, partial [Planctomycetes bacterium]|nr:NAD-dependent epimerase/dehydratase family protein [Planctomycetota bacterium]
MKVLVIGGSVFVGAHTVRALVSRGHAVTILNRGVTPDNHGNRVRRIHADRKHADALARALVSEAFDAAVDVSAYVGADTSAAIEALGDRVDHFVHVSTGQVYLVRDGCPTPARETDYDGALIPEPSNEPDRGEWAYGIGKRDCEDVLVRAAATRAFPSTRLRIPIVHGEGDYRHRLTSYLARLTDGGPVFLSDGGTSRLRHVDVLDVVETIVRLVESGDGKGEAFNLAWDETITLREMLEELVRLTGSRSPLVDASRETLAAFDLLPWASPLGSRWSSLLDPTKAAATLGFRARPWKATLARVHLAFRS